MRHAALARILALIALAWAAPVYAADINELRTMLGVTIGKFDAVRPAVAMTSMPSGMPCGCPDFCRLDVPGAGPGMSISVRWAQRDTLCGADLMTVQSLSGVLAGVDAPNIAPLYGMSPEQISARYGKPAGAITVAERQFVYCELLDNTPGAGLTSDLIYFGFLFSTGRLTAIRVGSGAVCPDYPFLPTP